MKPYSTESFLDWFLKQRILLHSLFWLTVLIYFTIGYAQNGNYTLEFFRSLAFLPNHIWLAYVFFYFLIPRFVYKNKIFTSIGLGIFFIGLNMYFSYLINYKFLGSGLLNKATYWSLGASLLGSLTILGIAVSIKLLRNWYKEKSENMLIKQEKMSAELKILKSQIHPHFLFNTLNNIYSLSLEKSPAAPGVILKLADLLRYMIYDCNEELGSLVKELEMMDHYIELEKMRYGDRLEVSKSYSGEIEGKLIPPLLFLPLLENCFKHGTSRQINQCWISIYLNVENDILQLKLINSKISEENTAPFSGGIGLQNVEKRLQLLYKDRYIIKFLPGEENFTVSLLLHLNESKDMIAERQLSNKNKKYEHQVFVGG